MFVGSSDRIMLQWSTSECLLEKFYANAHQGKITSLKSSTNSTYIFSTGTDGFLKQWSVKHRTMIKNFGRITEYPINQIDLIGDNLVLNSLGKNYFSLWNIRKQKILRHITLDSFAEIKSAKLNLSTKKMLIFTNKFELHQFNMNQSFSANTIRCLNNELIDDLDFVAHLIETSTVTIYNDDFNLDKRSFRSDISEESITNGSSYKLIKGMKKLKIRE